MTSEKFAGRGEAKGARRAVFLDRDGTINIEKDYLYRIEDFEFIVGVPQAIKRLNEAGFLVVVVTNQSGVARGLFNQDQVEKLHRHIQQELDRVGARIDGFYLCPHHPTEGIGEFRLDCPCRKGKPGMLLQAAVEHDIDLSRSFMIGDKMADVEAGEAAGCSSLLVLTGYGKAESEKLEKDRVGVFADLAQAVDSVLVENT